jgi:hypothetical protein
MAVEAKRGCGYRKIGGCYLAGESGGVPCDRLPIPLTVCPTCSHGFKQSRGFTWVDLNALVGGVHRGCTDQFPCPLCMATSEMGKAGLIWIGEQFYPTPAHFEREARKLGISRRIAAVPRNFVLGETWILLAHSKAIVKPCETCGGSGLARNADGVVIAEHCATCAGECKLVTPAIFKVWRPQRIEVMMGESQRGSDEAAELEQRGYSPVYLPDDDPDHRGRKYEEEEDD